MILVVGLSPTVQRTLRFAQSPVLGQVNRAAETFVTASGKSVNVARVVTRLGGAARLVHVLGGESGRWVARALADDENVSTETIWANDDAPTRTCATLLASDGGPTTELVEEARPISAEHVAAVFDAARAHLLGGAVCALCLSGSFPAGVPEDFYATLVQAAREPNVPVLVDAQRGPLKAALATRPFLVKPNREEAAATLGFSLSGEAQQDAETAVAALTDAGAAWALVSMGASGSLLGEAATGGRWRITPPRVDAKNPIGSGDSLAAGLLFAHFRRGESVPDAAVYGTACAAANCLTWTSGVVHPEDVAALLPQVTIARLA